MLYISMGVTMHYSYDSIHNAGFMIQFDSQILKPNLNEDYNLKKKNLFFSDIIFPIVS